MKIDKILLRISHFFGFRLNEEWSEDIKFNIPTCYNESDLNEILYNKKCNTDRTKYIIDDVIKQTYRKLNVDSLFEKRCRRVRKVMITYYTIDSKDNCGSIITSLPYIDGILYNPYESGVSELLQRNQKIDQLLND
jgi:hypothetical protein